MSDLRRQVRWEVRRAERGRHARRAPAAVLFHPLRTALVVVLVLLLFPALRDPARDLGARIVPGSAGCAPAGGWLEQAAHRAGGLLHQLDREPMTTEERDRYLAAGWDAAQAAGRAFRAGVRGQALPGGGQVPPADAVAAECCTGAGVLPAGYRQPGDTAAVAAARVAAAHWSGVELVRAVTIFGAESGWDPRATHRNSNGSTDYGLAQINSVHAELLRGGIWSDPAYNLTMARAVYDEAGGSWRPWATWNSGAWRAYEQQARQAVAVAVGALGPRVDVAVPAVAPAAVAPPCSPEGAPAGGGEAPGPAEVEAAIAFALAQRGEPYVYGANGPDTWDCSSLVDAAYTAAGVPMPGRQTTATLIHLGREVEPGQEQRGDLIFTSAGHVGLALGGGEMLVAPHTGAFVREQSHGTPWAVRRVVQPAGAAA